MGLDNIPRDYPCQERGLAIYIPRVDDDGNPLIDAEDGLPVLQFSCSSTQEAGMCPLLANKTRPDNGVVVGIFGTDCWYRGKWGYALAEILKCDGDLLYGGEADHVTPTACETLAEQLEEALDERLSDGGTFVDDDGESLVDDVKYLIWWLRWVGTRANGALAWY